MKIARFDKRIFSWLIDELIPCGLGVTITTLMMKNNLLYESLFYNFFVGALIAYIIFILLTALTLFFSDGFSLGSAILGIKTLNSKGDKLTLKQCFVKAISTGVIPFALVNALYMLFVRTERSVFDRLSNTIVSENRHLKD